MLSAGLNMETFVYVVMGTTGEYSDRTEWPVIAYRDESAAKAHVEVAETWLREKHLARGQKQPSYKEQEALGWMNNEWDFVLENPHDPQMGSPDYTGVQYYFLVVPLR